MLDLAGLHIRHRDIRLRTDALVDDIAMLAEEVFAPALDLDGSLALLLQVLHDLRYFQSKRISVHQDQIVAHPVRRIVRLIEQREDRLVVNDAVEDLFGIADLILKGILGLRILRGDHAAELVEDRQLTGAHSLQRVCIRQRANLVGKEHARKLTVKAARRVIERNICIFLHVADDGIAQDLKLVFALQLPHQRRRAADDLFDGCFYLTGKRTIRRNGIELGKLRLCEKQKDKQHRHKEGLAVLSADFQDGRLIPALCAVAAVHGTEHRHDEQPLEAGERLRHRLIGFQALRHHQQPQQAHNLIELIFVDDVLPTLAVGDLDKLGALQDHIFRGLHLAFEHLLRIPVGRVCFDHLSAPPFMAVASGSSASAFPCAAIRPILARAAGERHSSAQQRR